MPALLRRTSCVRCVKALGNKDLPNQKISNLLNVCSHVELYRRGERCTRCSDIHHSCESVSLFSLPSRCLSAANSSQVPPLFLRAADDLLLLQDEYMRSPENPESPLARRLRSDAQAFSRDIEAYNRSQGSKTDDILREIVLRLDHHSQQQHVLINTMRSSVSGLDVLRRVSADVLLDRARSSSCLGSWRRFERWCRPRPPPCLPTSHSRR